jgi:hypothetical protein
MAGLVFNYLGIPPSGRKMESDDMKKKQRKERMLFKAVIILVFSILLMIPIIPGVYTKSLPNENNYGAVVGISLAIVFRLLIIIWYGIKIKKMRDGTEKRKTGYVVIGILLVLLGLIYSDGALAFLDKKNIPYVSYFMFSSVFCDLIAAIITFRIPFLKTQKIKKGP